MSSNTDLQQQRTTNATTETKSHKLKPTINPTPQHNEKEVTNEMMKVQPNSQNPTTKPKPTSSADLSITIRWGVRAVARRQNHPPRGDLPVAPVNLAGGWEQC